MINFYKKNEKGFTRLVDFDDVISSRTEGASSKLTTGFTLVETLVALFIFSVSVIAVMSALSQGITSTSYAKNKMIAENLSQEGIEYFRNMRDTYMLYSDDKNVGWNNFMDKLNNGSCIAEGCYFDSDEDHMQIGQDMPITNIEVKLYDVGGECSKLKYETSSGKYNCYSGDATTFSRKIRIEQIDGDNIKIISEVTFSNGTNTGAISLSENLSKWIE